MSGRVESFSGQMTDERTDGHIHWVKPRRDMVRRRLESEHIQEDDDHLDGWPPRDVNLCWMEHYIGTGRWVSRRRSCMR